MAVKRIPISKKTRFEVFKRDKFTCQYCGKEAPDVILEIDHIIPVSKGGDNSIINLITSCFECNRGKGKKELSDKDTIKRQKKELDNLQERQNQLELMAKWKKELIKNQEEEARYINELICKLSEWGTNKKGFAKLCRLIKEFGVDEVYEATHISFSKYYTGSENSWNIAFDKIGGICYNRKNKITYERWKNGN